MSQEPEIPVGVETFHWKGQLRYRCPLFWESGAKCSYDTPDLNELKKHMVKSGHAAKVEAPRIETLPITHADPLDSVSEEFKHVSFAEHTAPSVPFKPDKFDSEMK